MEPTALARPALVDAAAAGALTPTCFKDQASMSVALVDHPTVQDSFGQGGKGDDKVVGGLHSSAEACEVPASCSIWSLPAIMPQLSLAHAASADVTFDAPLMPPHESITRSHSFFQAPGHPTGPDSLADTPFVTPHLKLSITDILPDNNPVDGISSSVKKSPLSTTDDLISSNSKRVTWMDACLPTLQGPGSPAQPLGHSISPLVSMHSAPVGTGDLRDQGRMSSAGNPRMSGAGMHSAHSVSLGTINELNTQLQGCTIHNGCISDLLGSLGTSLFSDSLPLPPAIQATAGHQAHDDSSAPQAPTKLTPLLPDVVEAWEGRVNSPDHHAVAALHAAAPQQSAMGHGPSQPAARRSSHSSGSAFASSTGIASAAAAAAAAGLLGGDTMDGLLGSSAFTFDNLLAHSYSTPVPNFSAAGGNMSLPPMPSLPAAHMSGSFTGLEVDQAIYTDDLLRTSSYGGLAANPGFGGLAPCYSTGGMGPHSFTCFPGAVPPLQGMASAPMWPAHTDPALAAMLHACADSSMANTAAPGMHEAWALAYLNSIVGNLRQDIRGSPPANTRSTEGGSYGRPAGAHFPRPDGCNKHWRRSMDVMGANMNRRHGSAGNSKVDPKSLCGVDPRLCVGNPSDVEAEVCRRNPGLAELLRIPPRSIKLNNIPVRQDPSPPELLASKRPDGPITEDELTIESGLLRHCFGLPSSIGPDLVRAARHSVTRGDTPGSGLEPFFWTLQAKLNWLLKRPVFYKGQLLRGEIHAITDKQRAQSFAQVTEQRSKLGELLLVMYRMLKL